MTFWPRNCRNYSVFRKDADSKHERFIVLQLSYWETDRWICDSHRVLELESYALFQLPNLLFFTIMLISIVCSMSRLYIKTAVDVVPECSMTKLIAALNLCFQIWYWTVLIPIFVLQFSYLEYFFHNKVCFF